jgi:hypothetical protein
MRLSLASRCLASAISRILLSLILATLLDPFLPGPVLVSALRFPHMSFSLSNLPSKWLGFLPRPGAPSGPDPEAELVLEEERVTASQSLNQFVDDHHRPLEHGKPLLPRLQPRRPPSRRATTTLPNTWIIQRIYEGQAFFKCVLCLFHPALVVGSDLIHSGWNFATYPDPTQCVSIHHLFDLSVPQVY